MPTGLIKLVVITGPTASGKTALGVEVALAIRGEVINADSQQIYKGMEIGTARPGPDEMKGVPHHLFAVIDPGVEFDAARYVELADRTIGEVVARGRVPILVGGTQLYIKALTRGLADIPEIPGAVRQSVKREIAETGADSAYRRLESVDPAAARKITPGDAQRIQRALEVYDATGVPISGFHSSHGFTTRRYECLKIAIRVPRAELHRRIERRTERLFAEGFIEEVRGLIASGYSPELRSFKAHGYRYAAEAAAGRMTVERAVELTARDTRRYAKRQETWLRSDPDVRWVEWPECKGAVGMAREYLGVDQVREAAE